MRDEKICVFVYLFIMNQENDFSEVVHQESRNRELKTRPIYECRCDERLKTKSEKSTRPVYTGLVCQY